MQGTTQSTTEPIRNKGGTSQKLHATAEALTPETYTPPGEQSYRYASGRAFVSFVISIIALPITWFLATTLINLTNRNVRSVPPLLMMQILIFFAMGLGITGLVLGIQGFRECNRTPGLKGRIPAIIGIILSSITIFLALAATIWTVKFTLESL